MDLEQAEAAAHAPGKRCKCTHQTAALFWVKWCHDRHLECMTSRQKFSLEEQSRQISSDQIWKDKTLDFFEDCHLNKNKKKEQKNQ